MTSDNPQEKSDSSSEQGGAYEHPNRTEEKIASSGAELESPITKNNCDESRRGRKHWLDYATFVLEILGLIGLFIYAALTYGIWCANKRVARDTHQSVVSADRNFRTDERAWLGFSIGGTIKFNVDQPFLIPTRTSNTGKTPAQNVHGSVVVGVFEKGESLNFDYAPGHHNASYSIESGTIFPNGLVDEGFRIGDWQPMARPLIILLKSLGMRPSAVRKPSSLYMGSLSTTIFSE